jgi:ubiquinone/menaquinone biosynthesis C-methylase UbiE
MTNYTTPAHTKLAEIYDGLYAAMGKDYQRESERLRDVIEQHRQNAGNTLLDVGCGTDGYLAFRVRFLYRGQRCSLITRNCS